jgi:hypothetical protein
MDDGNKSTDDLHTWTGRQPNPMHEHEWVTVGEDSYGVYQDCARLHCTARRYPNDRPIEAQHADFQKRLTRLIFGRD